MRQSLFNAYLQHAREWPHVRQHKVGNVGGSTLTQLLAGIVRNILARLLQVCVWDVCQIFVEVLLQTSK